MSDTTAEVMPTGSSERPQEYVADVSFDELGLSPELRRAIAERGYTHPTPVQAKAYGPARQGKDLIVRSKTGTGKTAAFGLPLIDQIPMGTREVRALIMCPTRELALQVTHELAALAKYRDVQVMSIYGGASMKEQEDALEAGASIVVGTPGRVFDHIRRGNLKLGTCRHAVLDEADEMLNQGFYEEVTRILDHLPKQRQVLLFSATVPEDIQRLIARYTTEPETLLLSGDVYTVEHIQHVRYELSDAYPKPRNLLYMLELEDPENAIIFCNTRDDTELVTAVLNRNGFDAELLNGDLPQKERERVMGRIKRGEVAFMVATDLAARGIDISDLGHVINYSLPEDAAVYLHRVGRTGRIGKKGVALNLTSGRELATLTTLEKKYNISFETRLMPKAEEANRLFTERHVREVKEAASGSIYEGYLQLATTMKQRGDADDLVAFLLKFFFTHRRMDKAQAQAGEAKADAAPPAYEPRGERKGRFGRDERRGGRDERRSGRERPARSDEATVPMGTLAVPRATATQAAPAGDSTSAGAPRRERPPRRSDAAWAVPESTTQRPKLSDRELFERLQRGEALPAIEDPTSATAASSAERSERPRRERGERRERRPREPRHEVAAEPGHSRLWLNLGKLDGVDEARLPAALEALGAPSGKVTKTELRGSYSYIHVADADVASFEALVGKLHNGEKALKVEKARERS
ncbi:MAG: DEAD/DEAH box helicase [Myxococcaceae bacterium]|nr:DEAD/DEAH box helicase [Myxococcaceae bacterium]MCA3010903.1 DEAD/DEAH box helicase [Myxococcaceae bacterium]